MPRRRVLITPLVITPWHRRQVLITDITGITLTLTLTPITPRRPLLFMGASRPELLVPTTMTGSTLQHRHQLMSTIWATLRCLLWLMATSLPARQARTPMASMTLQLRLLQARRSFALRVRTNMAATTTLQRQRQLQFTATSRPALLVRTTMANTTLQRRRRFMTTNRPAHRLQTTKAATTLQRRRRSMPNSRP